MALNWSSSKLWRTKGSSTLLHQHCLDHCRIHHVSDVPDWSLHLQVSLWWSAGSSLLLLQPRRKHESDVDSSSQGKFCISHLPCSDSCCQHHHQEFKVRFTEQWVTIFYTLFPAQARLEERVVRVELHHPVHHLLAVRPVHVVHSNLRGVCHLFARSSSSRFNAFYLGCSSKYGSISYP